MADGARLQEINDYLRLDKEILRAQIIVKQKLTPEQIEKARKREARSKMMRETAAKEEAKATPAAAKHPAKTENKKVNIKNLDEKLEEIFGERGRVRIQTFANDLKMRRRWHKFAVSEAPFRFSRNPNMMFFEVGRMREGEKGVEILYLGTGKTKETPEIGNEFAADSWGFAVLNLRDDLKQKEGE